MLDEATQDIIEIEYFIAVTNEQPLNADRVCEAINDTIRRIGLTPFAFKKCEDLATRFKVYRQASCLSYLVIYQITDDEIIICGVIHSARKSTEIRKFKNRNNHP